MEKGMGGTLGFLNANPEMLAFVQNYTDMGFFSILLFLFIGTILTMIVQASAATMAITLIMCANGWISLELGAALVLGENIGTTITANLAALTANTQAKRAALAHFVFNVFGVIWVLIIFHPFMQLVNWVRKEIQRHIDGGLFPYTKRYLGTLRNHFSTIGVNGINEMIRNFTDDKDMEFNPDTARNEMVDFWAVATSPMAVNKFFTPTP